MFITVSAQTFRQLFLRDNYHWLKKVFIVFQPELRHVICTGATHFAPVLH